MKYILQAETRPHFHYFSLIWNEIPTRFISGYSGSMITKYNPFTLHGANIYQEIRINLPLLEQSQCRLEQRHQRLR